MRVASCAGFAIVGCLGAILIPSSASAQTFTLIADRSIRNPVVAANFSEIGPPAIAGDEVLFQCRSAPEGLIKGVPTSYSAVAKGGDSVVGTTYTITDFSGTLGAPPTMSAVFDSSGRVASGFFCSGANGIASWMNGQMEGAITTTNGIAIPGGTSAFNSFIVPTISKGVIAFCGGNYITREWGVFTSSTVSLARIADTNTPIPNGTGSFTSFGHFRCTIDNGTVAFPGQGSGGQEGVYTGNGSTLTRIADTNTPVPGGTGSFSSFMYPVVTSDGVSFIGLWEGSQSGLYTTIGGGLRMVADSQTTYPGSMGFYSFRDVTPITAQLAGSGSRLAFIARRTDNPSVNGLLVWDGFTITKLVESGQTFQGSVVYYPDIGPQAVDGNRVGFKITAIGGVGGTHRDFLATFPVSANVKGWGLYE